MRTPLAIRMSLGLAILAMVTTAASAQVPVPWDGYKSFWNNPDTAKNLKLTPQQQQEMNDLLTKANQQFLLDLRSKFTPDQWKQIESLHAGHSELAAQLGLDGPDAQHVAAALRVNREAAQNYITLINTILEKAVASGAQYLQLIRTTTKDPCKDTFEAAMLAAPNLDSTQLKFTFTWEGKSYAGRSCPAGTANLKSGRPVNVKITYPCAITGRGVDLAPGCKISAQVTEYEY